MNTPYFLFIKQEVTDEMKTLYENLVTFSKKYGSFTKANGLTLNICKNIVKEDLNFLNGDLEEKLNTWEQIIVIRHDHFGKIEHYFSTIRLGCSQTGLYNDSLLRDYEVKAYNAVNLLARSIWNCYEDAEFPGLIVFGGEKYRTVPQFKLITFPSVDEMRTLYQGILGHEIAHLVIAERGLREEFYEEKSLDASSYLKHWEWELLADTLGTLTIGPALTYAFFASGFPILPILTIESKYGNHFCANILWHPPDEIRIPLQINILEILGITDSGDNCIISWMKNLQKTMNQFEPEELKHEFEKLKEKLYLIFEIYKKKLKKLLYEARTIVKEEYSYQKHKQACELADSLSEDFQRFRIPIETDPIIVLNALCLIKIRKQLDHKEISSKFIDYILQKNKRGI